MVAGTVKRNLILESEHKQESAEDFFQNKHNIRYKTCQVKGYTSHFYCSLHALEF